MMANIVIIPMTGWFQRRFGYRRYFAASVVLFTLASALCSLAWNLPSLVMFRALQGLGGGAIIPTAQSILFARYAKHEHGMAAALFGLGAICGPLLGLYAKRASAAAASRSGRRRGRSRPRRAAVQKPSGARA